jgi:rRNA-processing protein FCF1
MKRIILDTNFLTIPYQFSIDIFEEIDRVVEGDYELTTLDCVLEELKKLKKSTGKDAAAAKVALILIKEKNIKVIKTGEKNVDIKIYRMADKNTIVATNDRNLRRRLKNKNVKVLYLRSKKRIVMS